MKPTYLPRKCCIQGAQGLYDQPAHLNFYFNHRRQLSWYGAVFIAEGDAMTSFDFWAICDTDGGRLEPKPLARHIYATESEAKQAAEYRDFYEEHYPIKKVKVQVMEEVA